jgi:hypothetical protein
MAAHTYQTIVSPETHEKWNELKALLRCRSKSEVLEIIVPNALNAELHRRAADVVATEAADAHQQEPAR